MSERPAMKIETDSKARSNPARDFKGETPHKSRVLSRVNKAFARTREAGKVAALRDLGFEEESPDNEADNLANLFRSTRDSFDRTKKQTGNRHVFWTDGPASGQVSTGDRVSAGFTDGNKSVTSYGGV